MLSVKNLEVVYQDVILVLKGISINLPRNKVVALLGANGAGKTTVLRAISGLLDIQNGKITKGEIFYDENSIELELPLSINYSQDLKSRLDSFLFIGIDLPTDDLLQVIITKSFSDKQVNLNPKTSDYIIKNIDRSYDKIFKFINRISFFN